MSNSKNKRIGIFFFYDAQGVADRYIDYMLNDIIDCLDKLIVVCNGKADAKAKEMFGRYTQYHGRGNGELIIRENKGFDVWAYKEGIDSCGWEELDGCDELVLFNFTIMGPLYPFKEVFDEMQTKEVDFWGLNAHYGDSFDAFDSPYGYIPPHLQSHFLVFRKNLISSPLFHDYWDNMPEIEGYSSSVGKHESYLTKYFADHGYNWMSYTQTDDLANLTPFPLMDLPVATIKDCHCPIFKRKSFSLDNSHYFIRGSTNAVGLALFNYLREETSYDVSMITENIIRTASMRNAIGNIGLIRALSEDKPSKPYRVAVFVSKVEKALEESLYSLINSIPKTVDVILAEEDACSLENLYTGVEANFEDYDFVCVVNLPKKLHMFFQYGKNDILRAAKTSFLGTQSQIDAAIAQFEKDENIGCITMMRPLGLLTQMQDLWKSICNEWLDQSKFPFEISQLPMATGSGVFWIRTTALNDAVKNELQFTYTEERNKADCFDVATQIALQKNGMQTIVSCTYDELLNNYIFSEPIIEYVKQECETELKKKENEIHKVDTPPPSKSLIKRLFRRLFKT